MEAKELRIGNFVTDKWKSSTITVESINDKGINLEIQDDGNWPEMAKHWIEPNYRFDEILEIELTEEWLMKAGFKNSNVNKRLFSAYGFNLYLDEDNDVGVSKNNVDSYLCHVKYVHQLQNLYFALTGQELTFNHE